MSGGTRPVLPDRREHPDGNRSARQIAADLDQTRARLAETVDTLVDRVQPGSIAARSAGQAKRIVVTPEGRLRVGRLMTVAVSAAFVFAAARLLRGWVQRREDGR